MKLWAALFSMMLSVVAFADESGDADWATHYQMTTISQGHGDFRSPYEGTNSLRDEVENPTSFTATLFVGHKLWANAYIFANPEESSGRGLSDTHGVGAYPNGEIYRVDDPTMKSNISRIFFQQDFNLGGSEEKIEDEKNQFAATKSERRFTVVLGKFSLNDYFDQNSYAHDPRTQFLNWGFMDNLSWDYAADTRGYTWGYYLEYHLPTWSYRFAMVQVPVVANQLVMDGNILRANAENLEIEHRYTWSDHPGVWRLLMYSNQAHMGNYGESIAQAAGTGNPPDITATETYCSKYGFALNWEQEYSPRIGLFGRIGWNDGNTETWNFTEVDQTLAIGASFSGGFWGRGGSGSANLRDSSFNGDVIGAGLIVSGLSSVHADYLAAGGQGFILGDGALSYSLEDVAEVYYLWQVWRPFSVTGDLQYVLNPGFNKDRGPVPIYGVRLHFEI
jgi:high affinity Mn2+ porin